MALSNFPYFYVFVLAAAAAIIYAFTIVDVEARQSISKASDGCHDFLQLWLLSNPYGQALLGFGAFLVAFSAVSGNTATSPRENTVADRPVSLVRSRNPTTYFVPTPSPPMRTPYFPPRPPRPRSPRRQHKYRAEVELEVFRKVVPLAILAGLALSNNQDLKQALSLPRRSYFRPSSTPTFIKFGVAPILLAALAFAALGVMSSNSVKCALTTTKKKPKTAVKMVKIKHEGLEDATSTHVYIRKPASDGDGGTLRNRKPMFAATVTKSQACSNCETFRRISYLSLFAAVIITLSFAIVLHTAMKECRVKRVVVGRTSFPNWYWVATFVAACVYLSQC